MPYRQYYYSLIARFRYWVRQRTRPVSQDEAEEKREFFSKIYMFSSMALLVYLSYFYATKRDDEMKDMSKLERILNTFYIERKGQGRVIRFENFRKTEDYIVDLEKPNEIRERNIITEEK